MSERSWSTSGPTKPTPVPLARADLAAVTAPSLVIAGADDPATPPEHGAEIAAGIDGARLEVIPDAAHLAAVSAPVAVTEALRAHLSAAAAVDATWRDGR